MPNHILFEINEICPALIDRFESEGVLPNFKKYRAYFNRYQTQADSDHPALEPWIQWYSVHTGLPYSEHGVFRLTEGAKAGHADIWSILKERGYTVMNFSSMNTAPLTGEKDIFFPDPWNNEKANPATLQPIAEFIAHQIRDYTVPDHKINYVEFVTSLLKHGLSLATISMGIKQIMSETLQNKAYKYKRIFVLDGILIDIFLHYHKIHKPNFATFFSNSVAHIQHAYWRYFEPEKFNLDIDKPELKDAVKNAYINIDYRLGQLMRYAQKHNIKLSIASALSQRPYVKEESTGGRRYYRPRNINDLLEKLNIVPLSCEPVMTHQYILRYRTLEAKRQAEEILNHAKLYDSDTENPLFTVQNADNGIGTIFDCKPRNLVSDKATILINNQKYDFSELFYLIDEIKSGGHDPIGLFWQQTDNQNGQNMPETLMVYDLLDKIVEPFRKAG
jgi:hypothetical protein